MFINLKTSHLIPIKISMLIFYYVKHSITPNRLWKKEGNILLS